MMACFLVPMVLAIIFSAIQRAARSASEKLKLWILNALLWGGVVVLALEHVWHGEVVPWPPFLTAMANPVDIPIMLHEMVTIGAAMSAVTVAVWGIILALSYHMPRGVAARMVEPLRKTSIAAKP